jgi:hypothetical protein
MNNPQHTIFTKNLTDLKQGIENTILTYLNNVERNEFDFEKINRSVMIPETDYNEQVISVFLDNGQLVYFCENLNDKENYSYNMFHFSADTLIAILETIENNF